MNQQLRSKREWCETGNQLTPSLPISKGAFSQPLEKWKQETETSQHAKYTHLRTQSYHKICDAVEILGHLLPPPPPPQPLPRPPYPLRPSPSNITIWGRAVQQRVVFASSLEKSAFLFGPGYNFRPGWPCARDAFLPEGILGPQINRDMAKH